MRIVRPDAPDGGVRYTHVAVGSIEHRGRIFNAGDKVDLSRESIETVAHLEASGSFRPISAALRAVEAEAKKHPEPPPVTDMSPDAVVKRIQRLPGLGGEA